MTEIRPHSYVLAFSCPDKPGIVAAVTTAIFELGGNICDAEQFDDVAAHRFFARIEFELPPIAEELVRAGLGPVLTSVSASWTVRAVGHRKRVLVMASKLDHCLVDLVYRWRIGELEMDLVGVASNHSREVYSNVDLAGIPFYHLPITPATRQAQEAQLWQLVQAERVDLVVLARYMQILSDELSRRLSGRCINIHHSFLPGFTGARPYHQAHRRGVKLIGATAHYVTGELDEGPIIAQDVEPVSHRDTPQTLVRKGRDIERRVLARAVSQHLQDRVLLHDATTVVFTD